MLTVLATHKKKPHKTKGYKNILEVTDTSITLIMVLASWVYAYHQTP